ncbi:hypothetical protein BDN70DRAFT_995380 [Pholiota conissans]|uniref:Nephrocystin 3-like N-terminal domain-containing protein n=1 Tax=Pholiota conissans TaxID=109636 RepID=A0A9P5YW62_9AGAR|nr:hypothetical protein BDN70DRAFT_995380 [Pholiota conissans]
MFTHNRNIIITGGGFSNTTVHRIISPFERLENASALSALHDSSARFDAPKCHPNTRVAILEYIMGWIFGRNDPDALIRWLYGPAGAGKSAILQTIAERCAARNSILASFFFGRTDPMRNTVERLIPTIACQIIITLPETRPYVERAIENDPLVFHKSIATQLQTLIIHPLNQFYASELLRGTETYPHLILIDGLDECNDPKMQSMILRAFADALRVRQFPLILLIASRPEQNISLTFNSPPLAGLWKSLVLDDTYKPNNDIRLFLVDSFQEIKSTHPHRNLIPDAWPYQSDIDRLVEKSSGQFIFASVVAKYVSALHDRPPNRLEVIMGLRSAGHEVPFAELDVLYMHLLQSCPNVSKVMQILRVVLTGFTRSDRIEEMLNFDYGDIEVALGPLTSIVGILYFNGIHLLHASFSDFLVDSTRSAHFHINLQAVREDMLLTFVTNSMNPHLIPNNKDVFGLSSMAELLQSTLIDAEQLTDNMRTTLMKLSLPELWNAWGSQIDGNTQISRPLHRMEFVCGILDCFKLIGIGFHKNSSTEEYLMAYQHHVSCFAPIFRSNFERYYLETDLIHLAIIVFIYPEHMRQQEGWGMLCDCHMSMILQQLLQLTDNLIRIDECALEMTSMFLSSGYDHFIHLWNQIPRHTYGQTALRILQVLCSHRPRSIPASLCPQNGSMSIRHIRYLRWRREQRYRHGVKLVMPKVYNTRHFPPELPIAVRVGLEVLPALLLQSPESTDLSEFIRNNGKNIAFISKLTRKAIRAMHEYLDQVHEDA